LEQPPKKKKITALEILTEEDDNSQAIKSSLEEEFEGHLI